jgi:hypothetical protein
MRLPSTQTDYIVESEEADLEGYIGDRIRRVGGSPFSISVGQCRGQGFSFHKSEMIFLSRMTWSIFVFR